jgi:sulfur relay (sulfurtransferase) DsrF/TusC family protein
MVDDKMNNVCGPDGDVCVIDTKKLIEERAKQGVLKQDIKRNSVLFLLTRGTYGRFDDAYGTILLANAVLAKQQDATMILIGNGIYFAMKNQEPSDIFLPNNLPEISDFLELGGKLLVHRRSIEKRGIEPDELIEDIEMIEDNQIIAEIEKHNVSLTF